MDEGPELIPDPEATAPEDWDEEEDGEWEAPLVCELLAQGNVCFVILFSVVHSVVLMHVHVHCIFVLYPPSVLYKVSFVLCVNI